MNIKTTSKLHQNINIVYKNCFYIKITFGNESFVKIKLMFTEIFVPVYVVIVVIVICPFILYEGIFIMMMKKCFIQFYFYS